MNCPVCGGSTQVLDTRSIHDGIINRRRRECVRCEHKFSTLEVDGELQATVLKYAMPHIKAVKKRRELTRRNEQIEVMLRQGIKHSAIGVEFGLSHNMVSTIARQLGIRKRKKCKNSNSPNHLQEKSHPLSAVRMHT